MAIIPPILFFPLCYEGYSASPCGKIGDTRFGDVRLVEQTLNKDGYFVVVLEIDGELITKKVHKLIAERFVKNPEKFPYVRHKNEDKEDNRRENLEWFTRSILFFPSSYEGYSGSSCGLIGSMKSGKLKLLSQRLSGDGYVEVSLYIDNKSCNKSVHRFIATIFIPNPDNLPEINHKNGIKTDNRVENLEWISHRDNVIHAIESLGRKSTGKKIRQVSPDGTVIAIHESMAIAAKIAGVKKLDDACIYHRLVNGYYWFYDTDNCDPTFPITHSSRYWIDQYTLEEQFITSFPSKRDAIRSIENLSQLSIDHHVSKLTKVCDTDTPIFGYLWKKSSQEKKIEKIVDSNTDEWGVCKTYPNYRVDDGGNTYSLFTKTFLTHDQSGEYPSLKLIDLNGARKRVQVHRLVATIYVPNPNGKLEVNHKDGNKKNCHASNLEWVTSSENGLHSFREGLNPTTHAVLQIDSKTDEVIERFSSIADAKRKLGKPSLSISAVCTGKNKTAGGFKWRYA